MTIPNVDHLLDQAARLAAPSATGRPRQTDLRRAVSAACYAVFHCCLTVAADEFVGAARRATGRYALVYRSIDHRTFRDICAEVMKPTPSRKFLTFCPPDGFDGGILTVASNSLELQRMRHAADYDPLSRFGTAETGQAVDFARVAIHRFNAADDEHRKLFVTLLVCPPR